MPNLRIADLIVYTRYENVDKLDGTEVSEMRSQVKSFPEYLAYTGKICRDFLHRPAPSAMFEKLRGGGGGQSMNARQRVTEQHEGAHQSTDQAAVFPVEDRSGKGALWGPRGESSRIQVLSEKPETFGMELTATLNEFVEVVRASREQIAKLSLQISERDGVISVLRTEKATLEARLRSADNAPLAAITAPLTANEADAPIDPTPAAPAKDIGIWRRLTRLERE